MVPRSRLAVFDKQGQRASRGGKISQLSAGKLNELGWRGCAAPALEQSECGQDFGCGCYLRIKIDAQRYGVASSGGGEIRRQMKMKHEYGVRTLASGADAEGITHVR